MEALSRQVQNGGKRIDLLEFWANELKAPVSQPLDGAIFGAACALLSSQVSSVAAERRVKTAKQILASERNAMGEDLVQDAFVVRDWIDDGQFTLSKFDLLCNTINDICLEDHEFTKQYLNTPLYENTRK